MDKTSFFCHMQPRISVYLILVVWFSATVVCCISMSSIYAAESNPIIINTWISANATNSAYAVLAKKGSCLDAVEAGCIAAEYDQTQESISYGYHPDEQGNVTFDAMIINGDTLEFGAVASMADIKPAISVARYVMERTRHSMLVGPKATEFALGMGFKKESLNNARSKKIWEDWQSNNCQPNFRKNVLPDPTTNCGPYKPDLSKNHQFDPSDYPERIGHDTIGMIALDVNGSMAVGTTTNGAAFRVPGRVGDTGVIGAGGYVRTNVGGAVGTGDGDILMRYSLSFLAVELMSQGKNPTEACKIALDRIPSTVKFAGALAALTSKGEVGGACRGFSHFEISVMEPSLTEMKVIAVPCYK